MSKRCSLVELGPVVLRSALINCQERRAPDLPDKTYSVVLLELDFPDDPGSD
jgi:hypothetical protein